MASQKSGVRHYSSATTLDSTGTCLTRYDWYLHPRNGEPQMTRSEAHGNPYLGDLVEGPTVTFKTVDDGMADCTQAHINALAQEQAVLEYMQPLVAAFSALESCNLTNDWQAPLGSGSNSVAAATPDLSFTTSGTASPYDGSGLPAESWMSRQQQQSSQSTGPITYVSDWNGYGDPNLSYGNQSWQAQPLDMLGQSFGTGRMQSPSQMKLGEQYDMSQTQMSTADGTSWGQTWHGASTLGKRLD